MGREILAMILNHFKTPGLRNTVFTMEHIVKMQYFGDSQLDQFYHKWMECVRTCFQKMSLRTTGYVTVCIRRSGINLLLFAIKQYESWDEVITEDHIDIFVMS